MVRGPHQNTGAQVVVGVDDAPALADSYLNCYRLFFNLDSGYFGSYKTVKNGDTLHLGDIELVIMSTPGHSNGSITIVASDAIFVGDTVFFGGSYGRCDLPGGDETKLFASIRRIASIEENKTVYSGHGLNTTVAEIKSNFI